VNRPFTIAWLDDADRQAYLRDLDAAAAG